MPPTREQLDGMYQLSHSWPFPEKPDAKAEKTLITMWDYVLEEAAKAAEAELTELSGRDYKCCREAVGTVAGRVRAMKAQP